ncbi:unnamed protein product [Protopolystoma xenopodis]|uniref:Uncharacterized protein n=1 Tax=Protopolystoma xenopodis TaxID=117903 RepID=A0A3S5CVV6_9PLAT|nr:unnamed protein product [Protopolystoma xenopodis]
MSRDQLQWALVTGDCQEFEKNLEQLPDVNCTLANGRAPLHFAADFGQKDIIQFLLDKGANIDLMDGFGVTPLLAAIYEGHLDCVELLLRHVGFRHLCFLFKKAKIGTAPNGATYEECTESEAIKKLLRRYQ